MKRQTASTSAFDSVNFLPKSYLDRHRQRRSSVYQVFAVLVALTALIGFGAYQQQLLIDQGEYAAALQSDVDARRAQVDLLESLRLEKQVLSHRIKVRDEVTSSISPLLTIQLLSQIIPNDIGIESMDLVSFTPEPQEKIEAEEEKGSKRRVSRSSSKSSAPSLNELQIHLVGIAPDDQRIALLVERLDEHVIFDDVRMLWTRPESNNDYEVRRFRMKMTIPLDVEVVPVVADAQGGDYGP